MDHPGKLSQLEILEKKIMVAKRIEKREVCAIENATRLIEMYGDQKASMVGLANKISSSALELMNNENENEALPENLQEELFQLKSTRDNLIAYNNQLSVQQREGIHKEENLNKFIKERAQVRDSLKFEVEEKSSALTFVQEKLNSIDTHSARIHELHSKLLDNAQKFKTSINI